MAVLEQQPRSERPSRASLHPRSWSDRAVRRAGWTMWLLQLASLLLVLAVGLAAPPSSRTSSWGSQGLVADLAYLLLSFSFPCVGMVVIHRQPRNAFGWVLLVVVGMGGAISNALDAWATFGLVVEPGSLPGAGAAASLNEGIWVWMVGGIGIFLILLFPDGRLPSRRWRWLPWTGAFVIIMTEVSIAFSPGELTEGPIPDMTNPLGVPALEGALTVSLALTLPLLPLCILASAIALVLRFRRSIGVERQQLKWLAATGAVVAVCFFAAMASQFLKPVPVDGPDTAAHTLLQNLALLSFMTLPVAIGIAVLRHRLYDIDRLINRALVYGTLSLLLAGVYVGLVLGLRLLLDPFTGDSELAVAASTLAVAALFRPVRRRIQRAVDHRFYRQRYDAVRTIESFAGRLRQEVDLDTVSDDLRGVVRETIQPAHVSLWLRRTG